MEFTHHIGSFEILCRQTHMYCTYCRAGYVAWEKCYLIFQETREHIMYMRPHKIRHDGSTSGFLQDWEENCRIQIKTLTVFSFSYRSSLRLVWSKAISPTGSSPQPCTTERPRSVSQEFIHCIKTLIYCKKLPENVLSLTLFPLVFMLHLNVIRIKLCYTASTERS